MSQCATRGVMDAFGRPGERRVPSPPPGFSDSESSTVSRERRRVALVCRELGAELLDKIKATNEEMEARLGSKFDTLTASVNGLMRFMAPPVNGPPVSSPIGPVATWCYWMPVDEPLQPECELSPYLELHAQSFTLHSRATSEAGDGGDEGCGGHAASWEPLPKLRRCLSAAFSDAAKEGTTQVVRPDHVLHKYEDNIHIPIFPAHEQIVQYPVVGQKGFVDQMPAEASWVRLASAELARSRLAHLRNIRAAPASARSMVSRTAGHSSSSEEEDVTEMEMDKEIIEMEKVIDHFIEELGMLAKTKGNPVTRQKVGRLVTTTAKRLGMTPKDLMACVKQLR